MDTLVRGIKAAECLGSGTAIAWTAPADPTTYLVTYLPADQLTCLPMHQHYHPALIKADTNQVIHPQLPRKN